MLEGFDFSTPSIANRLTDKLAALKKYNVLRVSADYFGEAMGRLRDKFLNIALEAVLHPASAPAQQAAVAQQAAASAAQPVGQRELTAQEWFERAFDAANLDEQMRCYTEGIRLKPDHWAYNNRAVTRHNKGDLDGALADFAEAIRLKANFAVKRSRLRSHHRRVA